MALRQLAVLRMASDTSRVAAAPGPALGFRVQGFRDLGFRDWVLGLGFMVECLV